MVGGVKLCLESNPIPTRVALKAQKNVVRPGDPTEIKPDLPLSVSCRGTGQQWPAQGQGLWVQQTWVWHKPFWRRSPLTSQ